LAKAKIAWGVSSSAPVDHGEGDQAVSSGDLLYEGNPFVARKLQGAFASRVDLLSIFLAPFSREEIQHLRSPKRNVALALLGPDTGVRT